jgi:hypothetical protein
MTRARDLASYTALTTLTGTQTLTNKTLTSPAVNTATITTPTITAGTITDATENFSTFVSPTETGNIVAAAATGTINFNVETSSVWYYTTNASANFTLNFRYNGTTTLNSKLSVGEVLTVVFMNTNGATAYYPNVIQIDGTTVTPLIQGGSAITSGNVSSVDAYSFTIIKTAATPTYVVLESQTQFK